MNILTRLLLLVLVNTTFLYTQAQSCTGNLLTGSIGYYGGFEAGANNFSTAGAATDYKYGMPPNGTYEIVNYASNAGGGGYLSLAPHSGSYQMLSHTRSASNNRIWYKTVSVTPGTTYQFCAWIANAKKDPVSGFKINLLVNGNIIATKTAVYGWSQVCGTYTVPTGITSITLSITDPDAHTGPSHFLGLDDICFTPASASTLSLGNLVWNDTNGSGKKDANEPGIPGVSVSLYHDANSDNKPDGAAIATVTTNAQGNYLFTGLMAGRYIVSIPVLSGYGTSNAANTNATPDNNIDNDNNAVYTKNNSLFTNAITLKEGTEPTDDGDGNKGNLTLDLALCGNGVIGDFVWNDLNANGLQDAGEPGIAGAVVILTYTDGTTSTVNTDNDGYYYFRNLGPGNYQLSFNTPAGFTPSVTNAGSDEGLDSDATEGKLSVTLASDQSKLTVDAGFNTGTTLVSIGNFVWNDVNGNGLKDASEIGIANVLVKLYRDADGNNVADGATIATISTNAQGYYSFGGLAAGKYLAGIVVPEGYSITPVSSPSPDDNVDNDNNGVNFINATELRSNSITLTPGTEPTNDGDGNNGNSTLDFGICGTSNVGDFVWNDTNGNGLQDTGEPGFAGVIVVLVYADGSEVTTTSDANGMYKFINLGPGTYTLKFTTPDGFIASPAIVGTNTDKDSNPANGSVTFTLAAGTNNFSIDAGFYSGILKLGNMVWNDTNNDGIRDSNEPGIAGVQVRLYKDDNNDDVPDGSAIATTITNQQGSYLFAGLANANYIVGVTIPNGYAAGTIATVTNPNNDVDNDNNGVHVNGSEVFTNSITLAAGSEPATDGDNASGNLTLDIALTGTSYIGDFVWNDINGNGIQDTDEPGLADVVVMVTYGDGTTKSVTTNASGIYYFSNVGPGTYTITFTTPASFASASAALGLDRTKDSDPVNGKVTVTVLAGESNLNVDAGFKQEVSMSLGNLVWNDTNNNGLKDATESGLSGITVNLYADANGDNIADGSPIKMTTTNAQGAYLFSNLPQGKYIVGVLLPAGYAAGAVTTGSGMPDNNLDNDNNGTVSATGEVRTKAIMLSSNAEPTSDGDDANGNLTTDIGLKLVNTGCTGNLLSSGIGYYGGFEAGTNNMSPGTGGSDLYTKLPRNGSYEIVSNVSELGGGGYLDVQPNSGSYFLAAHTSNRAADRVWYTRVSVVPGTTYNFCMSTRLLKNLGNGANFIMGLYINGVSIASGRLNFEWTSICGSYVVPAGVTSIEIAIKDPKKGLFFAAIDDICFTPAGAPAGVIGNYVFSDVNSNGIQDAGEGGISNVVVALTENGVTRSTITNSDGFYQFTNVAAGTKLISFTTPDGYTASPSNVGTDDAKDSDPVGGSVTFTLAANEVNNTIDAGFYLNRCVQFSVSNCGTGFITKKTSLVANGSFKLPVIAPAAGNTFSGTTNLSSASAYSFAGAQFKSQSDYRGTGYSDQISGTQNAFSIINTNGATYNASFSGQETVSQLPFPGDIAKGIAAENSFMFWNGNQFASQSTLVWEQNISGLTIGKTYTFRFYASNLMQPVNGNDDFNDPMLTIKLGGTSGLADGTKVFPMASAATPDWYQLTKSESANATTLNGWKRFEITFVADAPTQVLKIIDNARGTKGDVLGITAIGVEVCEKDTDGDCIPDVNDIDDDNDGITDVEESAGYDPLADCDSDGITNLRDLSPGCERLTWMDCNGDRINDLFDFDRDGIINQLDLDSDNDGILDVQETGDAAAVDNNNDGMVDGEDKDADGLLSSADADDTEAGGPGLTAEDMDRDGQPSYLDLDSDGEGVNDLTEAIETVDADGLAPGTDTDGDGVRGDYSFTIKNSDTYNGFGAKGIVLLDNDQDGRPNAYDIDTDDDGITDNVEAQPTCSFVPATGKDDDGDGLDNAYDIDNNTCILKASGITPFDKEGDGTPDMYDTDSDNDGAPDVNEGSGLTGEILINKADADDDGLVDQFDIFNIRTTVDQFSHNVVHSNMGMGGSFDGLLPAGSNARLPQSAQGNCTNGADRDWRNTTVLPVILVNFNGKSNNGKTELVWTVASEVGMKHYVVERSINGQQFSKIGQVTARGANTVNTTYGYIDDITSLASKAVYYRLQMVDLSGGEKASNILSFKATGKNVLSLGLYPNPATVTLQLKINTATDGMVLIRMIDGLGKLVKVTNARVSAGANLVTINDLSQFPSGNYTVQMISDGQVLNEKLSILR